MKHTKHLSAEPLDELCAARIHTGNGRSPANARGITALARETGLTGRSINRYQEQGWIPIHSADKIACALGYHPLELWPDFHDDSHEAA